jgi:excisionase family DNA binding protein
MSAAARRETALDITEPEGEPFYRSNDIHDQTNVMYNPHPVIRDSRSSLQRMNKNDQPSFNQLMTLVQASAYCGLSASSLRVYANRGRLRAWKVGSEWLTTKEAIDEYLASRDARGQNR